MAALTLADAKKYIPDNITRGVVDDIYNLNPIFSLFPFIGYEGQGLIVNRETSRADADFYSVNATITNRDPSTVTQVPFTSTKIIGDVDLDKMITAQSASMGIDQAAIEISSKAKEIGRLFQNGMINGTGTLPQMNSFVSQIDSTQSIGTSSQALSFTLLDSLLALVKSKDGMVDFILMAQRTFNSYKVLLRALGGSTADWVVNLPDGRTTIGYEGIPIFVSPFQVITETAAAAAQTGGNLTSVWAGCFDDGSQKIGISGIHPISVPAGISVEVPGTMETKDSITYRIKQYANLAVFNRRGLARLTSINN